MKFLLITLITYTPHPLTGELKSPTARFHEARLSRPFPQAPVSGS